MFCPKCSQEQVSDEVRFCSRCGFQLNVVKALLADGAAQAGESAKKPDGKKLRMRDVTIGAFLMAVLAVIGAAITMDLPPPHTGRIFVIVVMWIGLAVLLNIQPLVGYFLRGDSSTERTGEFLPSKIISKLTRRNKKSLPEAHGVPAADLVFRDAKTAQMAPPPSITEPTTNLLNKH